MLLLAVLVKLLMVDLVKGFSLNVSLLVPLISALLPIQDDNEEPDELEEEEVGEVDVEEDEDNLL